MCNVCDKMCFFFYLDGHHIMVILLLILQKKFEFLLWDKYQIMSKHFEKIRLSKKDLSMGCHCKFVLNKRCHQEHILFKNCSSISISPPRIGHLIFLCVLKKSQTKWAMGRAKWNSKMIYNHIIAFALIKCNFLYWQRFSSHAVIKSQNLCGAKNVIR